MGTNTTAAIDMEKYRQDLSIKHATHNAFGDIPVDEKYLPIMRAWLKGASAEYAEKILMDLIHEINSGNTSALITAINDNRQNIVDAMREFRELSNKGAGNGKEK